MVECKFTSQLLILINRLVSTENVSSSKCFDLILDQNLSFEEQIEVIKTIESRAIGLISKIKSFPPEKTLTSLYYLLLKLHLLYEVVIRASALNSYRQRLRTLQNRTIQIITNARYTDSSNPLQFKFNFLKIDNLFNFECAKTNVLYLSNYGQLPSHLN